MVNSTEAVIAEAYREMAGTAGRLVSWLAQRRGVTRSEIHEICVKLRRAADTLEKLT